VSSRSALWLWLFFSLFIVYGTTIPFHFTSDPVFVRMKLARVTLNPLVSPDTGGRVSITDTTQNILLFLPFGVLGVVTLRNRVPSLVGRVALVTGCGAVLSGFVETLQLFTTDRTTSVADFVTNSTGAAIGGLGGDAVAAVFVTAIRRLVGRGVARPRVFYPLIVATIVLAVAAWEPFDVSIAVSGVSEKVHELARDPWQFTVVTDEGVEILRYFLFGLAVTTWLHQLGVSAAWGIAALVGITVGFGLEGSQIVIGSRMPGLEDALVHSAGAVAGAFMGRSIRLERLGIAAAAAVVIATALGAACQELSPFQIASTPRPFVWFPFINYYERTTFETVSHAIELLLMYFPLGFVITLCSRSRRRAYVVSAVLAFAIAAPLEYAQGWIVGRYPDITDVGLSVLGACAGGWFAGPGWRQFEMFVVGVNRAGESDYAGMA